MGHALTAPLDDLPGRKGNCLASLLALEDGEPLRCWGRRGFLVLVPILACVHVQPSSRLTEGCPGGWSRTTRRSPRLTRTRDAGLGWSGGGRTGRREPCQRIEGAVDGGFGDIGEAEVAVAGVAPQPGEGLGQIDAGAF